MPAPAPSVRAAMCLGKVCVTARDGAGLLVAGHRRAAAMTAFTLAATPPSSHGRGAAYKLSLTLSLLSWRQRAHTRALARPVAGRPRALLTDHCLRAGGAHQRVRVGVQRWWWWWRRRLPTQLAADWPCVFPHHGGRWRHGRPVPPGEGHRSDGPRRSAARPVLCRVGLHARDPGRGACPLLLHVHCQTLWRCPRTRSAAHPPLERASLTGRRPQITRAGFTEPTPIQAQAWPVAMEGRDVVAIAKTGSGKTCGFLLPGFMHIKETRKDPRFGPTVLVVAPTRELANQIQAEANKFGHLSGLRNTYAGPPARSRCRLPICVAHCPWLLRTQPAPRAARDPVACLCRGGRSPLRACVHE